MSQEMKSYSDRAAAFLEKYIGSQLMEAHVVLLACEFKKIAQEAFREGAEAQRESDAKIVDRCSSDTLDEARKSSGYAKEDRLGEFGVLLNAAAKIRSPENVAQPKKGEADK